MKKRGARARCHYPGITEKRMANKRFRRTEDAILRVFFEEVNYVSVDEMAKKIGVSRSTIYYHHRAVREIIPDYEVFLLRRYRRKIRKVMRRKGVHMKTVYINMLLFIIRHREGFTVMMRNGNREILEKMVLEVTPKTGWHGGLPKNTEKVLRIYVCEVTEVLWLWGEDGFLEDGIKQVLRDVVYLTNTARQRLKPMTK